MTFHCFLNISVCLSISFLSPPTPPFFYFWRGYFTSETCQQVSCQSRGGANTWKELTATEIFMVLSYCDWMSFDRDGTLQWPFLKQKADVLLSVASWEGETECMLSHYISKIPNSQLHVVWKRYLRGFYWSTIYINMLFLFLLFHSFPLYYFPHIPSWQRVLALVPLSASSSPSVSNLISFAVSSQHRICNDRLMAAPAVPRGNNSH